MLTDHGVSLSRHFSKEEIFFNTCERLRINFRNVRGYFLKVYETLQFLKQIKWIYVSRYLENPKSQTSLE